MTTSKRLQLKIVLDNLDPVIWRRVVVSESLTFLQLHKVIQAAMGWEDCHMHEFELAAPRLRIGTNSPGDLGFFGDSERLLPERTTRLADVLAGKRKFRYWYDFGDDWWHTVIIEKRLPPDPTVPPAQLLAGEFSCPPEDCGGPPGYVDMMEIIATSDHPEREGIMNWLGPFDPLAFDLERTAKDVARTVRPPKARKLKTA